MWYIKWSTNVLLSLHFFSTHFRKQTHITRLQRKNKNKNYIYDSARPSCRGQLKNTLLDQTPVPPKNWNTSHETWTNTGWTAETVPTQPVIKHCRTTFCVFVFFIISLLFSSLLLLLVLRFILLYFCRFVPFRPVRKTNRCKNLMKIFL